MYKPPDLLDQLSQAAREQALEEKTRLDSRWDRLAAGALSEAENDELLGLADASGEAHEAYQAFKKLGPAFEKRVAAAILARQQVEAEERLAARAAEPAAARSSSPMRPPAKRRSWVFGSLGSAAGLAAALGAFFFFTQVPLLSSFVADQPPGLAEVRGNAAAELGGNPVYSSGNEIPLVANASIKPGEDLEVGLFYVGEEGLLQRSDLRPTIKDDGGTVEASPIVGEHLMLSPGTWKLAMVIARQGEFPDSETILEAVVNGGRPAKYWQVLVFEIKVEQLEPPGAP